MVCYYSTFNLRRSEVMTSLDEHHGSTVIRTDQSVMATNIQHAAFIITFGAACALYDRADAVKGACSLVSSAISNGTLYVVGLVVVGIMSGTTAFVLSLSEHLSVIYKVLSAALVLWVAWSAYLIFTVATNSATCIPSLTGT
jgi:hypothetical protein